MRFVLCDDDRDLRSVVTELLEARGHQVVGEAETSLEAGECLERLAPDAIIVDLSLRFGSGVEVLEAAAAKCCAAIVFTAYADDIAFAVLPGAPLVVAKPEFEALEAAVDDIADRDSTRQPIGDDRRRSPTRGDPERAPTAVDDGHGFYEVLGRARHGDVLMSIRSAAGGDAARVEELATVARRVVRAQDWVMTSGTGVQVLVLGGAEVAAASVGARFSTEWTSAHPGDEFAICSVVVDNDESPSDAFMRLKAAISAPGR